MEKTEIGPYFQFMASWPKKSNFEGVKIFLGPKIFLGYPILGFLTLKSTKKFCFWSKTSKNLHVELLNIFGFFRPKILFFWSKIALLYFYTISGGVR